MDKIIALLRIPVIFVLFAFLTFQALYSLQGLDYFFHIKTGEYIVTHKDVPDKDIYSFTMQDKKWTNHEWLYQVIIYSLFEKWGIDGLFYLRLFIFSLAFFLLLLIALQIDWFVSFFLIFFGLKISFLRFILRPDNFSFLFFIIFLIPFILKKRKLLLLLPFVQLLWVNIHGFFFLGPLVLLIYLLTGRIGEARIDDAFYDTVKKVFLLSILACFLNPAPATTLIFPFRILGDILLGTQKVFYQSINELKNPLKVLSLNSMYFRYVIVTGLSLFCLKKTNIFYTCLWFFMLIFSLNSIRNFYFCVPISIALVVNRYPFIKEFFLNKLIRERGFRLLKVALVVFIISICIKIGQGLMVPSGQLGISYLDLESDSPIQIKDRFLSYDHRLYPEKMRDFMKEQKLPDSMYNNFNLGAYLIFNFFPERKVFIDGRCEFYGPRFFKFYENIKEGDEFAFKEAIEKYKLEGFIISYLREKPTVLIKVLHEGGFKCVYFDRDGVIFLKESFLNKNNHLKPFVIDFQAHQINKIDLINKVKLYEPSLEGYYNMAWVLHVLGFDEKSKEYLQEILKVFPNHANCYYLLGKIYYNQGEYEKAFSNCRSSLYFNRSSREATILLAKIYVKTNNMEDAREVLNVNKIGINFKDFLQTVKDE